MNVTRFKDVKNHLDIYLNDLGFGNITKKYIVNSRSIINLNDTFLTKLEDIEYDKIPDDYNFYFYVVLEELGVGFVIGNYLYYYKDKWGVHTITILDSSEVPNDVKPFRFDLYIIKDYVNSVELDFIESHKTSLRFEYQRDLIKHIKKILNLKKLTEIL
jgi:hypothetical protein